MWGDMGRLCVYEYDVWCVYVVCVCGGGGGMCIQREGDKHPNQKIYHWPF